MQRLRLVGGTGGSSAGINRAPLLSTVSDRGTCSLSIRQIREGSWVFDRDPGILRVPCAGHCAERQQPETPCGPLAKSSGATFLADR